MANPRNEPYHVRLADSELLYENITYAFGQVYVSKKVPGHGTRAYTEASAGKSKTRQLNGPCRLASGL